MVNKQALRSHAASRYYPRRWRYGHRGHWIGAAVRESQQSALVRLVLDLYDLSADNRSFIEARLALREDSIESYKQRISEALYPDVFSGKPIRIGEARRAITEYRKAAGDQDGLLELMFYYVECGTACTADLGDIDEQFYGSLESMYDRALNALDKAGPSARKSLMPRAAAIVSAARGIGWGYYDYLADRFAEAFPNHKAAAPESVESVRAPGPPRTGRDD